MRDPLPLLLETDFPRIRRARLDTLQINVGYRCNQSCLHCHVSAGPNRKEEMSAATAELILQFLHRNDVHTLDITGGAPELNPSFRRIVAQAAGRGTSVIDRCNLTILEEPGFEDMAEFLAEHNVRVVASLPCYLEENVDSQRGNGVFASSIRALKRLNALGYGYGRPERRLDLVYNPQGPVLPPPQQRLQSQYQRSLKERYDVSFDQLLTLANLPVGRFGSTLLSKGQFHDYMQVLRKAYVNDNLSHVMCRNVVSVDWEGYAYDCDFNQMLNLPMRWNGRARMHLSDLLDAAFEGRSITVGEHCYACTAGQGSSCTGALS